MLPLVQSANNLRVTASARSLATSVYRATARFPAAERFGLTSQMRRAAVSIGSNIAEGCGRTGDRELARFFHIALGSASELEFQIAIACDLALLDGRQARRLSAEVVRLKRMLAGLIKALRRAVPGAPDSP